MTTAFPLVRYVRLQLVSEVQKSTEAQLFALLDAARDPDIIVGLRHYGRERVSLYRGELEHTLSECAPYLVRVPPDSALIQWLAQSWGKSWGVYFTSMASIDQLRTHFRKFLLVQNEAGKELYFRFYDPRVLRLFLPACNPEETRDFFGPVERYLVEDRQPEQLLRFWLDGNTGLAQQQAVILG